MDALYVSDLSKAFGGAKALSDVTVSVKAGEIHGLVGRNGSGKSTLIKILSGYHAPDSWGAFQVAGKVAELPLTPGQPASLGLSFVHQDLGLLSTLSVLENFRVGRYKAASLGRIKWRNERRHVTRVLDSFGLHVSLDDTIGQLAPVDRALVAIARALSDASEHEGGTLILDEPTSFLPRDGVEKLFSGMRRVAAEGLGVVFVSHRLEEILSITDRVTVLRDGRNVGTVDTPGLEEDDLIEMILGERVEQSYASSGGTLGGVKLSISHLSGPGIHDLSFDVREGEILGLTGLAGMGHEAVVYLAFGAQRASEGSVTLEGREMAARSIEPRAAIEAGFALLPGDRLHSSGVGSLPVSYNVSLPVLGRYFRGGWLRERVEIGEVEALIRGLDVRPPDPTRILGSLSGGNQQKALLGKWLQTRPKALLLDEPSQGVDVAARKEIFSQVRALATEGAAVVISSTDWEDLAHVCDRVLIFRYGRIVAEVGSDSISEEKLIELCYSTATRE
ncbi:MAG: sugar ABC transporter ATP-binding protein [Actinomycetota bacterium]|nr:sugar ABC transporter ATP-binding protein [Actinomycetota bacterium]